jgi:hypothetical protein
MALSTRLKTLLLSALGLPDIRDELTSAIDSAPAGPASSTSGNVALWGGTDGRLLTDSLVTASGGLVLANGIYSQSATGGLYANVAGSGFFIKEGTNAKMGTATLVAGAATVSTTKVSSTSRIFLTSNADGGTPGWLRVSARSAGTSFTITSSSGTDTSTVAWMILEPAP